MDKPTLTFGSLFAGIGGIDLGLERAGMRCEWQVENNEFCQKVLAKHWPDAARYGDVRSVGHHIGDIHTCYIPVTSVDVLAGGFPCQPHSQAGERKASQDERDLWPEFYRLIRELEPRWVVAENVLGLLSSEDGAFFGGILRDLAKAGYDARWQVLSAAQFGAPHLRERVFIVAHASEPGLPIRGCAGHPTNGAQTGAGLESEPERHGELADPDRQSLAVGVRIGRDTRQECTPIERDSNSPIRARAVESGLGRDFARISTGMDGDINEKRHQANTDEVLPGMWASAGEKEIQRQTGRLSGIHAAPVLQSGMYGDRENQRSTDACSVQKTGNQASGIVLPEMRDNRAFTSASSRQQPNQQQSIEPSDAVRLLSCKMALAKWEKIAEKAVGVQALRSACAALGYVPETLSALQEVWQSLSHEKKSWVTVYASGRTPWPAAPGQEQYDWEPSRVVTERVPNRTARLKGLGNAVVPALAEYVGRCIVEAEQHQQGGVA